jgi:hypothetical protein
MFRASLGLTYRRTSFAARVARDHDYTEGMLSKPYARRFQLYGENKNTVQNNGAQLLQFGIYKPPPKGATNKEGKSTARPTPKVKLNRDQRLDMSLFSTELTPQDAFKKK